jgi:YidC/Oxa1 family membrane protein insertase
LERRFLLFMVLSLAVLTVNGMLMRQRVPRKPAGDQAAAEAPVDGRSEDQADAGPQAETDEAAAPDESADEAAEADEAADEDPAVEADDESGDEQAEQSFLTLGSLDENSGYRILATLTNRGAAVQRLELSSPRYLDMNDRAGYLGHLELTPSDEVEDGLLVRSVGSGTPAAKAGLKAGDRIVAAGAEETKPVASVEEFQRLLVATKPRQDFQLAVLREGGRQSLTAKLARRPLEVIRPESENYLVRDKALPADFAEPPSFELTLESVGQRKIDDARQTELAGVRLRESNWKLIEHSESSATFEQSVPRFGLVVRKKYELAKAAANSTDRDEPVYHLTLTVTVENAAGEATREVSYRLDGPNGLPVEGWWYLRKIGRSSGIAGLRDVVGRYYGAEPQQQSATAIVNDKAEDFEGTSLAYIGVDSHYFCVALIPEAKAEEPGWTQAARPVLIGPKPIAGKHEEKFGNVSCRLIGKPVKLAPGAKFEHTYRIFAGPKRPQLLSRYVAGGDPAYTLEDFVYYGLSLFAFVAQKMVQLLHVLYAVVRNYGVAIVLLTALVKGLMFPVNRSQNRSMAKMQALKPEMEKLKEKYKGDQQKQAQAMQQLYRKHNVNPLAGCLPMFLQLPVLMGLWRGLSLDVELRQAPLLGGLVRWCSNLAAPDMLLDWSRLMPESVNSGQGILGLGPYLNLLPLVTIALFLWQQKMFMPPAADEQAAMQQSMMKWMSIFISIMFYTVPSGLCIYLITSSLFSIAERKLVPPVTAGTAGTPSDSPAPPAPSGEKPLAGLRALVNGVAEVKHTTKAKRRK